MVFLTVLVPPAATLVWLGAELLDQDRKLLAQRNVERLQAAVGGVTRSLDQALKDAESWTDSAPEHAIVLRMSVNGMEPGPSGRLLWVPVPPRVVEPVARVFAQVEALEYVGRTAEALTSYEKMSKSIDEGVRAGALLRMARIYRRDKRVLDAIAVYDRLEQLGRISEGGMPVDLLALRAKCVLQSDASSLRSGLSSGRWLLDQPAWELAIADLRRCGGGAVPQLPEARLFSVAAAEVWKRWQLEGGPQREVLMVEGVPLTAVWRRTPNEARVTLIHPTLLGVWARGALNRANASRDRLALLKADGSVVMGQTGKGVGVKVAAFESGLPWSLVMTAAESSHVSGQFERRRQLLTAALIAITVFLAGGSYLLWRVVRRELAVAKLQTDFVSAVSHEFRTPLTSLRHISELLEDGDEMSHDRRRVFYTALTRNTERLHRLVESLLDFARMDSGRKPYVLQPVNAGELAAAVVRDFAGEALQQGVTVHLENRDLEALVLNADAAALTRALWNLLDNAVKYSPNGRDIWVTVERKARSIVISVRDEGIGIPHAEKSAIFGKFVRGATATQLGIKGTGLGLAMVSHIVAAHGGRTEMESEERRGSTFRIVLPQPS
jgi:signal transduction histidine kinase